MKAKHVVVILGMHRSGTSALAGELHHQGVHFGKSFIDKIVSVNQKGFYEHKELVAINEEILLELKSSWYDCFSVYQKIIDGWRPSKEILQRIKYFFSSNEFNGKNLIGIKDPRLCVLYPIWHEQIVSIGYKPKIVIVNRNVTNVANSLAKRDGMVEVLSSILWRYYTICAASETAKYNGYWIETKDLFLKPSEQINYMYTFFNIDIHIGEHTFIDQKIPKSSSKLTECNLSNKIDSTGSPLSDINWEVELLGFVNFTNTNLKLIKGLIESFQLINKANILAIQNGNNYTNAIDIITSKNEVIMNKELYISNLSKKLRMYENIFGINLLRKIKQYIK